MAYNTNDPKNWHPVAGYDGAHEAGRAEMSMAECTLCFKAGAETLFAEDKLRRKFPPPFNADRPIFSRLGLKPGEAFRNEKALVG